MDEERLDKLMREKLDGYEDPSFDESALVDFHEKLAAVHPVSWYEGPVTHYAIGLSIAITTLICFLLYSPTDDTSNSTLSLFEANNRIDSLQRVIDNLKSKTEQLSASNIASEKSSVPSLSDLETSSKSSNSEAAIVTSSAGSDANVKKTRESIVNGSTLTASKKHNQSIYLAPIKDLPAELYQSLVRSGMLMEDDGSAFLVTPDRRNLYTSGDHPLTAIRHVYRSPNHLLLFDPLQLQQDEVMLSSAGKESNLSNLSKEETEKINSKGIGFNIAPHIDLVAAQFSFGKGLLTPRVGFLGELVFSPNLSAEAGIDYSTTSIDFDRDFQNIEIPNLDTKLGTINSAHIKNSLLSVPIAFKYRKWISNNRQGFIRISYTPYYSILQEYQCGYKANYGSSSGGYGNHGVTSILQVQDNFMYGNTSGVSLGITQLMHGKNKLEGSLFYETSLSAVGHEKLAMTLFGIRTAYWFKVR